ncbi:hypothetical protein MJO28_007294 [Puccinia striiformis f. sp. tritici]|uniref:Uncharacterized protein n=3 Tax=Puccinia striiformis TaxID=27350 RepID=A0A2S4W9J9_9BASI|nr:hypothetical protein MJO28_007294 [Puccinia striiformis f. sp. tritici]POW18445.1 hypothetical protein PSHT_05796 [Puccinia striiformis]
MAKYHVILIALCLTTLFSNSFGFDLALVYCTVEKMTSYTCFVHQVIRADEWKPKEAMILLRDDEKFALFAATNQRKILNPNKKVAAFEHTNGYAKARFEWSDSTPITSGHILNQGHHDIIYAIRHVGTGRFIIGPSIPKDSQHLIEFPNHLLDGDYWLYLLPV